MVHVFVALGAKITVTVTGSLKFDISVTPQLAAKAVTLRRQWAPHRPVWIATSTHEGEESVVIAAHQALLQQFPNLLLIPYPVIQNASRMRLTLSAGLD